MEDNKQNLENEEILLESAEVKPFENSSDWYGTNGEAVLTFQTMRNVLWHSWKRQCVQIKNYNDDGEEINFEDFEKPQEYLNATNKSGRRDRIVEPENFDYCETMKPGIYRDGTYYDEEDSVDEAYTIIVPHGFLTQELCEKHIDKLNQKFNRKFRLNIKEEQKRPLPDLKKLKISLEREEIDQDAKNKVLESITEIVEDSNSD